MRSAFFAVAVGFTVMAAAARPARACGSAGNGGNYAGLAAAVLLVGSADLVFTLWDTGSALASHHPSAGYGLAELLIAGPQAAMGISFALSSGAGHSGGPTVYAALMSALAVHGIWTIATADEQPSGAPLHEEPAGTDLKSRASVSLGTTFVPVGQFSQPGVGLVGRF